MAVDGADGWEVRTAIDADLDDLTAMRLKLADHMAQANQDLLPMSEAGVAAIGERYREALGDPGTHIAVARVHATRALVGMAMGRIVHRDDLIPAELGRVDDVWVDPDYRRQGISRALLRPLLAFFERKGVELLMLEYTVGNAEAEAIWTQLGFRPLSVMAHGTVGDVRSKI
jgi:ribosomal protein S18 acetylase RimI-like enzyme